MSFVYQNTTFYLEDAPIGEGTYSYVYPVKDSVYVVKLYKKKDFNESVFENEKKMLISFKDYNGFLEYYTGKSLNFSYFMIKLLTNGIDVTIDGSRGLVIGKVDGITLEQLIYSNEVIQKNAVHRIISQLQLSVNDVNLEGYMLSDLKPSNVMVDEDYGVTIIDLGSCIFLPNNGITKNDLAITPNYMCKKLLQINNSGIVDEAYATIQDMWSVGLIYLELTRRFISIDYFSQTQMKKDVDDLLLKSDSPDDEVMGVFKKIIFNITI